MPVPSLRVLGIDPGLRRTGWGVIEAQGSRLVHVANGAVQSDAELGTADRLFQLHEGLMAVIEGHDPQAAAVEETLVNKNAGSTLKLGLARGVALLVPARAGLTVAEYLPMVVKKSVVGTGHATKEQVTMMVKRLLPGCEIASADAADALAVAICHAHHAASARQWEGGGTGATLSAPKSGRKTWASVVAGREAKQR